jgi:hypothetical protein
MEFDKVEDLKKVKIANHAGPDILDQSKSDLSAALDAAMRSFAPNHIKRVVLLSDGNENAGTSPRCYTACSGKTHTSIPFHWKHASIATPGLNRYLRRAM